MEATHLRSPWLCQIFVILTLGGSRATSIVSETHPSDMPPPSVVLLGACVRVAAGTFSGCSGGSVSGNAGPDVGDAAHAGDNGGVE